MSDDGYDVWRATATFDLDGYSQGYFVEGGEYAINPEYPSAKEAIEDGRLVYAGKRQYRGQRVKAQPTLWDHIMEDE